MSSANETPLVSCPPQLDANNSAGCASVRSAASRIYAGADKNDPRVLERKRVVAKGIVKGNSLSHTANEINMSRQTLSNWLGRNAPYLRPRYTCDDRTIIQRAQAFLDDIDAFENKVEDNPPSYDVYRERNRQQYKSLRLEASKKNAAPKLERLKNECQYMTGFENGAVTTCGVSTKSQQYCDDHKIATIPIGGGGIGFPRAELF